MSAGSLVVLGGGPGGYAAAFYAADRGLDVTLVDSAENPGGVCLYRGCIPSKALLHVARVLHESRAAAAWGIEFAPPKIDLARLRAFKDRVVRDLTGGLGTLGDKRGVKHVRGTGRFTGAASLEVDLHAGGKQSLRFEHAIVATGSEPVQLPMLPDSPLVMDSTSALDLPDIPETLLVIGGGYIGLELGTVYAALGTEVTVVEMMDTLLAGVDGDLVRPLRKRLDDSFAAIHVKTRVVGARASKGGITVRMEGPDLPSPEQEFRRVLAAVGRRPRSRDIGLEAAGVRVEASGFVQVDPARRTSAERIFAIGDVAGQPMLAHKASHEARVAVDAVCGERAAFEPRAIPAVVFTDPEIAWCGLTEAEARAAGRKVAVSRFPWAASGRARTLDRPEGVTKLVIDPESERILGVGITGAGAGELIGEATLAVEMAARASDLKLTIHAHPTLSETLMEAAELFYGEATHFHRPKRG